MFDKQKTSLFETSVTGNQFLTEAMKSSAKTSDHGNGALKYNTSGNEFLDQFAKITEYRRPRSFSEISKDMSILWSINPEKAFKLVLWDIPNDYYGNGATPKFESFGDRENFFYLSGLDGSTVSFLLGKSPVEGQTAVTVPKTAQELFEAAMDQEILNEVRIF